MHCSQNHISIENIFLQAQERAGLGQADIGPDNSINTAPDHSERTRTFLVLRPRHLRGGPFDIWGGVEENMEINKIFPIWLKINKLFLSLLEINKLFLKLPEKNGLFHPKNNLFAGLIP